jgi:hypothetical protein
MASASVYANDVLITEEEAGPPLSRKLTSSHFIGGIK